MGSQVARSVPEKLLGLLDAFSYDASAYSLSELARRTGWGIPLGSGRGRGGAIRDFHLSEDMLRILEVMPPDRTLRSYPNLPAALTAAPESVRLSAGWLAGWKSWQRVRDVGLSWPLTEAMDVRRYLLVLDMDLLAVDEELDLQPINYLVARQEQEPCEVLVMSLVRSRQSRLPAMQLALGAVSGKFPFAPRPDHDIGAAAEHRMDLAVRQLKTIGCQASGMLSDEDDMVKTVRSETDHHDYDEVILATGSQGGSSLARGLHLDPIHQLRRHLGQRLIVFPPGQDAPDHTPPA